MPTKIRQKKIHSMNKVRVKCNITNCLACGKDLQYVSSHHFYCADCHKSRELLHLSTSPTGINYFRNGKPHPYREHTEQFYQEQRRLNGYER